MEPELPVWTCNCGRTSSLPQSLTFHGRTCPKTKKRVSEALEIVKGLFREKRQRRAQEKAIAQAGPSTEVDDLLLYKAPTLVPPKVRSSTLMS